MGISQNKRNSPLIFQKECNQHSIITELYFKKIHKVDIN